jgi:hypothetical protein
MEEDKLSAQAIPESTVNQTAQKVSAVSSAKSISSLGKEVIDKTLCYVIQAKCPGIETVKFWIAPSNLFKLGISPDTIVWDYRTESDRSAGEAGISK